MRLFWKPQRVCGKWLRRVLDLGMDRKKSTNRSQIEANTMDVIEALHDLDKTDKKIRFMCEDIKDLPQNNPEELNSIAVLKQI